MNEAIDTTYSSMTPFNHAYADRLSLARNSKAQGKKVVGFVGNTVPVELILAAGMVPCRLSPIDGDLSDSDAYVETFADSDVRRIFQLYITGKLDVFELLIIPRSSESHHKLYLMLREANRVGLGRNVPQLFLYEILHTQRETSRLYGIQRTVELWKKLLEINTHVIDEVSSINHAIRLKNQQRYELNQLHEMRWRKKVTGVDALKVSIAAQFMPVSESIHMLKELINSISFGHSSSLNLLVRGVPNDQTVLHEQLAHFGVNVLAEDDDWGARSGLSEISETSSNPIEKVFEHYWRDVPCGRKFPTDDTWFLQKIELPEVDGVVFYLPEPEDVYGWSYPADLRVCRNHKKVTILIRTSCESPQAMLEEIKNQLELSSTLRADKKFLNEASV